VLYSVISYVTRRDLYLRYKICVFKKWRSRSISKRCPPTFGVHFCCSGFLVIQYPTCIEMIQRKYTQCEDVNCRYLGEGGEFLDHLSECQLLSKDSALPCEKVRLSQACV